MIDNNFIHSLISHDNARHRGIDATIDNNSIKKSLNSYLKDIHNLQRYHGLTKATFHEFISLPDTGKIGIAYILRSIQTHNDNAFIPKEPDYDRFAKGFNSTDHAFTLIM